MALTGIEDELHTVLRAEAKLKEETGPSKELILKLLKQKVGDVEPSPTLRLITAKLIPLVRQTI